MRIEMPIENYIIVPDEELSEYFLEQYELETGKKLQKLTKEEIQRAIDGLKYKPEVFDEDDKKLIEKLKKVIE